MSDKTKAVQVVQGGADSWGQVGVIRRTAESQDPERENFTGKTQERHRDELMLSEA